MTTKVLFVCLGNICRSPTAHGVFEKKVAEAGLEHLIEIDSAGTGGWHIGKKPDSRAITAASQRGYDLTHLRARQANQRDFSEFDIILAMDESNLYDLQSLKPHTFKGTLSLFLSYGSQKDYQEVPDPYYGGAKGFDLVLDLIEDACDGLLEEIKQRHL